MPDGMDEIWKMAWRQAMLYPPSDNALIEGAIKLAVRLHAKQTEKAGAPYILHVLRVALAGQTTDEIVVGALHDILEDTEYTVEALLEDGFHPEQVEAIKTLTRREAEPYMKFIARVKKNPLARAVKLNDLRDNLQDDRINNIPYDLVNRYIQARALLEKED